MSDKGTTDRLVQGDLNHFRHGHLEVRADAFEQPYLERELVRSEGVSGEPEQDFVADAHRNAELPFAFETNGLPWVEVGGNRQGVVLHGGTIGVSATGAGAVDRWPPRGVIS